MNCEEYLRTNLPNYDNPKISDKSIGHVKGYGANTNQGIVR
jgi:hypothetical protein